MFTFIFNITLDKIPGLTLKILTLTIFCSSKDPHRRIHQKTPILTFMTFSSTRHASQFCITNIDSYSANPLISILNIRKVKIVC
jgi:hypothetical protein